MKTRRARHRDPRTPPFRGYCYSSKECLRRLRRRLGLELLEDRRLLSVAPWAGLPEKADPPDKSLGSGDEFGRGDDVGVFDFSTTDYDISSGAPARAVITRADFRFAVVHSWVGDLTVEILSPEGTPLTMWNRAGGNTDWGLDDDPEDDGDVFFQRIDVDAFNGEDPSGVWRLRVSDGAGADEGFVDYFYMTLYYDDAYEPNDTLRTAYDLADDERTWLSSIAGLGVQADDDWYRIEVTPGQQRVLVDCRFTHHDGDVDVALLDSAGTMIASARSVTDNEYLDYIVPDAGTYYILVFYGNAGNAYDLWWDDQVPPVDLFGAGFDALQEPLGAGDRFDVEFAVANDEPGAAGPFWVDFYLSPDTVIGSGGDYYLGDYRVDGLAGGSTTGTRAANLTLPGRVMHEFDWPYTNGDGTYYVGMVVDSTASVDETNEANNHSTGELLDYESVIINDTHDDAYEPNNTLAAAYDLSSRQRTWLSWIAGQGIQADDDWYRIEVTPGQQRVLVDCRFTHHDGDVDVGLLNSAGTMIAAARSVTDNEFLDYIVPGGGTYYILVFYGNAGNAYDLWWDDQVPPVDLFGAGFDVLQEPLGAGDALDVQFVVANDEPGTAGPFRVDFYLSPDTVIGSGGDCYLGNHWVDGLAGGSTTGTLAVNLTLPGRVMHEFDWPYTNGDGTYYVGMVVDATASVDETDEANNHSTGELIDYQRVIINDTHDDAYEPNNTLTAAYDLSSRERTPLSWIAGQGIQADPDWYRIEVTPGEQRVLVDCRFTHSEGDIELALCDASGTWLASSLSSDDNEYIDYEVPAGGGTFYILVTCDDEPAGNAYDLWWDDVSAENQWTIFTYINADNELAAAAEVDINEMEAVVYPADVEVLAMVDFDGPDDTYRGRITHDTDPGTITSPLVHLGERDMGDPGSLAEFLVWGAGNYPAERYTLVAWDHGGGFRGFGSPEQMEVNEIRTAIEASGVGLDLLGFDAGLMGMTEVAYEMRNLCDTLVASEAAAFGTSWPYTEILAALANDPAMTGAELGQTIVYYYADSFDPGTSPQAISSIDTSGLDVLAAELDDFAFTVLQTAASADGSTLRAARNSTTAYLPYDAYRDLGQFMAAVSAGDANPAVRDAAQDVLAALGAAVDANWTGDLTGGQGLSVYLPAAGEAIHAEYNGDLAFVADTRWDGFIRLLAADDGYEPNDLRADAYHPGYNWEQTWLSSIAGTGIQADDDWYQIDVTPGCQWLIVDLIFSHAAGNIDLQVVDASGTVRASSTSTSDDEHVDFLLPGAGTWYVRVYGAELANTYDLWWDDCLYVDLLGSDFDLVPLALMAGDRFDVDFIVTNDGSGPADWFDVDFYLGRSPTVSPDDYYLGTRTVDGLDGQSDTGPLTADFTLPEPGDPFWNDDGWVAPDEYYVGVIVDAGGRVREIDETNNRGTGPLLDFDTVWIDPDDRYEQNDSLLAAYHPGFDWRGTWLGDIEGIGVQLDNDWYQIEIPPGSQRLTVELQFSHAEGDVDVEVYDAEGGYVTGAYSTTDNEIIDAALPWEGMYYLKVFGPDNGQNYDLRWARRWQRIDLFGFYFEVFGQELDAGQEFDVEFTVANGAPDHAGPFAVDFYLSTEPVGGGQGGYVPLGTFVHDGLGGHSDTGLLGMPLTLPEPGDPFWVGEGEYYVGMIVDAHDQVIELEEANNSGTGAGLDYLDVWISVAPDDPYEENDWLLAAYHPGFDWEAIPLSEIEGPGVQLDADWYEVDVTPGEAVLTAYLYFSHAEGNLDLEVYDSGGGYVAGAYSTTDDEFIHVSVPAGESYFLKVFGPDNGQSYDLLWYDSATRTFFWDQQGPGNWHDMAGGYSRWVDAEGHQLTGYPQDRDTDVAVVKTDVVTLAATHAIRELHVESGGLVAAAGQGVNVYGEAMFAEGTKLTLANGAGFSASDAWLDTVATYGNASFAITQAGGQISVETLTLQQNGLVGVYGPLSAQQTDIGPSALQVAFETWSPTSLGVLNGNGVPVTITKQGWYDLILDQAGFGLQYATFDVQDGRLIGVQGDDNPFGQAQLVLRGELVLSSTGGDVTFDNAVTVVGDSLLTAGATGGGAPGPWTVTLGGPGGLILDQGTLTLQTTHGYSLAIASDLVGPGDIRVDQGDVILLGTADLGSMIVTGGTVRTQGTDVVLSDSLVLDEILYAIEPGHTLMASSPDMLAGVDLTLTGGALDVGVAPGIPSDGLLAKWTFDNCADPGHDDSGNGRDLELRGSAYCYPQIDGGGELSLTGSDAYAIDEDAEDYLNGLSELTVAMWIHSWRTGVDRGFWECRDSGTEDVWGMRYDAAGASGAGTSVIKAGMTTSASDGNPNRTEDQQESSSNVQTANWQHVVLTWEDGVGCKIYLDGRLDTPTFAMSNTAGTLDMVDYFAIGKGAKNFWWGNIDEVYIFDRALDQDEVTALYWGLEGLDGSGGPIEVPNTNFTVAGPAALNPVTTWDAIFGHLTFDSGMSLELRGAAPISFDDVTTVDMGMVQGDLIVRGTLAPGGGGIGALLVDGQLELGQDATYAVQLDQQANDTIFAFVDIHLDGTLTIQALSGLGAVGEATRTIIGVSGEAFVDGIFAHEPEVGEPLGYGVFYLGTTYHPTAVDVELFQAAAGDADGDHYVDPLDVQAILAANKFGTGLPAVWGEGEFTGDGVVNGDDTQAMLSTNLFNTGRYESPPPVGVYDGEVQLVETPDGLIIDTFGKTINGYVLTSDLGIFTGEPASGLGLLGDEDHRISDSFFTLAGGTHILGQVIGQEFAGVDLAQDLTFTYTIQGQSGVYVGQVHPWGSGTSGGGGPDDDHADGGGGDSATFYWSDGREIPLYALQDELVVGGKDAWTAPVLVDAETGSRLIVTDEIIVALEPGADPQHLLAEGLSGYRRLRGTTDQYVASVAEPGGLSTITQANALYGRAGVAWAVPNFRHDFRIATNDPLFGDQWHLHNTGQTGAKVDADADLPEAWAATTGSQAIVIAVLDNGVQTTHPDLNVFVNLVEAAGIPGVDDDGNGWVDDVHGWDFKDHDNDPSPATAYDNHGTAVAGVAGAVGNNALGVTGAAQRVRILPIKIARDETGEGEGFATAAEIAEAIYYAAGRTADGLGTWRGADILVSSWAGGSPNDALANAFQWASTRGRRGRGAACFNSAGNEASGYQQYGLVVQPGNWIFEWRYEKDASGTVGADTAWLAGVELPDGTVERFDSLAMPTGWSTSGDTSWSVVDDPAHAYGTGRYTAQAGSISHGQTTRLRSPTITVGSQSMLKFRAWVSSQEDSDRLNLYASNDGGGSFLGPYFGASGTAAVDSAVAYPAWLDSTIAVGASTDWDLRADYSQYGSELDFVAPSSGGFAEITTTDRTGADGYNTSAGAAGDYTSTLGGTSAATPLAAGVAALVLTERPNLTAEQLRQVLRASADKIGRVTYTDGFNEYYGYGRLNAATALVTSPPVCGDYGFALGIGAAGDDVGYAVATDEAGNVYVAGQVEGVVDFDPGPGTVTPPGAGGTDVFVAKYSTFGTLLWARRMGGAGRDQARAIAVADDGSVYITGLFQGIADFDPGDGTFKLTSAGEEDVFVCRLNPDGDFVWARQMGGADSELVYGIALGDDGSVYTAGAFRGTADFDPGPGTDRRVSAGGYDAFLSKLESHGDHVWALAMGGPGADVARGVALGSDGSVHVAGVFEDTADFLPGQGTSYLTSAGSSDVFVAKYASSSGGLVWARGMGGAFDEHASGIAVGSDDSVYTAGNFEGTTDLDPGPDNLPLSSAGQYDVFVSKLDAAGNLVWARQMGGELSDVAAAIALGDDDCLYTTGLFTGTADFDPGPQAFYLAADGGNPLLRNGDAFVSRLDPAGRFVWARQLGGPERDYGQGIAIGVNDSVYTTGGFRGTADFDPGPGPFPLTSSGMSDVFLAKLTRPPIGDLVWNDLNGDGIQDAGEPGIKGVEVRLFQGIVGVGYVLVAVTTTDHTGYYRFENNMLFQPGNYYVQFMLPGGFVFSPQDQGPDETRDSDAHPASGATYDFNLALGDEAFYRDAGMVGEFPDFGFGVGPGSIGLDEGRAVTTDWAGNVLIVGRFTGTVDLDPGPQTWELTSEGEDDAFLAKYGSAGNLLWARALGGPGSDAAMDVAVDARLNVYVTGSFRDTADFDPDPAATRQLTSAGDTDAFVARFDRFGRLLWVRGFGGGGADVGLGIALDRASNVYTTGSFSQTAEFNPGRPAVRLTSAGEADVFMAKLDASGNFGWARRMGGPDFDQGTAIDVDTADRFYVTGHFSRAADFDPTAGVVYRTSAGGTDVFVACFDPSLPSPSKLLWVRTLGGPGDDYCNGIAVDQAGTASYITGAFQATVDFDPGPGTENLSSAGEDDVFAARFDAAGDLVWARRVGGTGADRANDIALDHAENHVYLTGLFEQTVDFDPGSGVFTRTSLGAGDLFIWKLDEAGDFKFARSVGGQSGDEEGFGIAVDRTGDVYVVGVFYSSQVIVDPSGETPPLQGTDDGDIIIVEESPPDSISDYVWHDQDQDGIQDVEELGKLGVTVELFSAGADRKPGSKDDTLIETTTTDEYGLYIFWPVSPGDYYIKFTPPTGFALSAQSQGSDDNVDSDPDPTTYLTGVFSLALGDAIDWEDAGVYNAGQNNNPVADDDFATIDEDHTKSGNVLDNDNDVDDVVLSAEKTSDVSHGMLTFYSTGAFTYTPDPHYHGPDSFTYRADDGHGPKGQSNEATVWITIEAVNDVPEVANPIADVVVEEGTDEKDVNLAGAFDDADVLNKADTLTLSVADNGNPTLVTATLDGTLLTLSFTPENNGTAEITIRATDSSSDWVEDTFTVTVNPAGTVPTLSINNVLRPEGDTGTTDFVFTVGLSQPATDAVSVTCHTVDGTGVAGTDYQAANGTLTFDPGDQFQTFTVSVLGDTYIEADKTFTVVLSNTTFATIGDGTGEGTIFDDDGGPFQMVSGSPATVSADEGEGFSVAVQYTTSDANAALTGLGLRLHFNSSMMTFDGLTDVLSTGLDQQEPPASDTGDFDGDPQTDKYVLISWDDGGGNWPGGLPVSLLTANFTLAAGLPDGKPGAIRFSAASTASSYVFLVEPIDVTVVLVPKVVGRYIFYNRSAFDGNDAAANASDDAAIATDKVALMPGGTATFANYTSYSRGINGIMVDVQHADHAPTAEDFQLRIGNSNDPGTWSQAPDPAGVTVRAGEGAGGSDRVTIIWNDNLIQKQWLQVTVPAGGNIGLAQADVFYFGNAIGESGNSTGDAKVNAYDMLGARDNPRTFITPATIDFNYDFNRDKRVNAYDMLIARDNQTHFLNDLNLISVPMVGQVPCPTIGRARKALQDTQTSLPAPAAENPRLPRARTNLGEGAAETGNGAGREAVFQQALEREADGHRAPPDKWAWLYQYDDFRTPGKPSEENGSAKEDRSLRDLVDKLFATWTRY